MGSRVETTESLSRIAEEFEAGQRNVDRATFNKMIATSKVLRQPQIEKIGKNGHKTSLYVAVVSTTEGGKEIKQLIVAPR